MKARQHPAQRKMGVNISLDLQTLEVLDQQAAAAGMTRSALLRRLIMESVADLAEDQALLAQAEAILEDPDEISIPWEEAKALLRR
jgi:hypothetical protein